MGLRELLIGKPLRTEEEQVEQIGPATGIPVLGLDALGSAAYGPEAALTVLLPLGACGLGFIEPITLCIIGVLIAVFFSYRQTIPGYPQGGGSYTVARENLGPVFGLIAASALCVDYILNVAVAIAAGTGALVSAAPGLLPYTLPICLGVLGFLTVVNLRGIRSAGLLFMMPTYLFVACLFATLGIGIVKTFSAGGHPAPVAMLPHVEPTLKAVGIWMLLHAFASGCTALTGVEAVSNAVPIFRKPTVKLARLTLTILVLILGLFLCGIAFLCHRYGITATPPGQTGYQSILSQLVSAVVGRNWFYYVTIAAIVAVLSLSANTSFADFPRVCRVLALDEYLPAEFAHRGSRLVYTSGIIVLATLSAVLLIVFRGVTDRLIPLFAVGAFSAFTLSQCGMVIHWHRARDAKGRRRSLIFNSIGALATFTTLIIITISKFKEGAWITLLVVPPTIFLFLRVRKYHSEVSDKTSEGGPLDLATLPEPLVAIPIKRLDGVARKAIRLAMRLASEVHVVQILSESMKTEDLTACWENEVATPARTAGCQAPKLVVISSEYREFFGPFLVYLKKLSEEHSGRPIGVMIPEVVEKRWYHFFFRHRTTVLKGLLLMRGGPQIFIINLPWYVEPVAPTIQVGKQEMEGAEILRASADPQPLHAPH